MADTQGQLKVLADVRVLLALPENDFTWSSWRDTEHALEEIDSFLGKLSSGVPPDKLSIGILFAPTGPIQEVALSSGWGDAYLELADRFDAAMAGEDMPHSQDSEPCPCFQSPGTGLIPGAELGMDDKFGEVSILRCPRCGQLWLKYLYELEGFTGSGRWYIGTVPPDIVTAENARAVLESLDWYFCGGSYYNGQISKASGTIRL